jgi:hypothetical protein
MFRRHRARPSRLPLRQQQQQQQQQQASLRHLHPPPPSQHPHHHLHSPPHRHLRHRLQARPARPALPAKANSLTRRHHRQSPAPPQLPTIIRTPHHLLQHLAVKAVTNSHTRQLRPNRALVPSQSNHIHQGQLPQRKTAHCHQQAPPPTMITHTHQTHRSRLPSPQPQTLTP